MKRLLLLALIALFAACSTPIRSGDEIEQQIEKHKQTERISL